VAPCLTSNGEGRAVRAGNSASRVYDLTLTRANVGGACTRALRAVFFASLAGLRPCHGTSARAFWPELVAGAGGRPGCAQRALAGHRRRPSPLGDLTRRDPLDVAAKAKSETHDLVGQLHTPSKVANLRIRGCRIKAPSMTSGITIRTTSLARPPRTKAANQLRGPSGTRSA
jgi:hypothetical protein